MQKSETIEMKPQVNIDLINKIYTWAVPSFLGGLFIMTGFYFTTLARLSNAESKIKKLEENQFTFKDAEQEFKPMQVDLSYMKRDIAEIKQLLRDSKK
ncbi:hypothetical protein [Flexithrix dorotheae]|uniref:hypothetical protein n=1 Tax=Flexithrix dorotheae TaxID=70993 RepID=UPI00036D4077|nr:hypothetical protein [Flexithrix dorotheae]